MQKFNIKTTHINKQNLVKVAFWVVCFIAPVLMLCMVATTSGVYPFGLESFLTEDLKYQYVDFYRWFQRVLLGQESLLYSTELGLGANTWGLYSYYLASPFNVLLLFFNENDITLFVFLSVALKLGCMQIAAVVFLKQRFGLRPLLCFLIALCYTWSMWTATNLRNPMWLDALILLPLLMLAVWKLISQKRWLMFAILTALNIIVCWYTAYISVLFCILMFLLEWVCSGNKESFWKVAIRFAGASLLALGLSMWTFLPTVISMQAGGTETASFIDVIRGIISASNVEELKDALFTTRPLIKNLVIGLLPLKYKLPDIPQLYCGVWFMISLLMFFTSSRISKRVKVAAFVFVLIVLLSICLRPMQAVWCGFREPNGFFSRPSMLVAPLMMWISAYWLNSITHGRHLKHSIWDKSVNLKIGRFLRTKGAILLSFIVVLDLSVAACLAWRPLYLDYSQEQNDSYFKESREQVSWLKSIDSSIWRMERSFTRAGVAALNESMSMNYIGLSSYSSVHNHSAVNLLNSLGYGDQGRMHVRYSNPIIASDALLGLKYSSCNYSEAAGLSKLMDAPKVNNFNTYENTYALSLGYLVSDNVGNSALVGDNPFERQNSFASELLGERVELFKAAQVSSPNRLPGEKTWTANIPVGCLGFAYVEAVSEVYLEIDGQSIELENWRFQHSLRPFPTVDKDSETLHTVRVASPAKVEVGFDESDYINETNVEIYYLDLDVLSNVTSTLSEKQINFSQFSGLGIEGTINSNCDGWAMISVPNEKGWVCTVNGKEVKTKGAFEDALTLVPVSEGENSIQMRFQCPGLTEGAIISIITALGLAIFIILSFRRKFNTFR